MILVVGTFSFFQVSLHCSWTDLLLSVDYNCWKIMAVKEKWLRWISASPPGGHQSVRQALTVFHLSQAPEGLKLTLNRLRNKDLLQACLFHKSNQSLCLHLISIMTFALNETPIIDPALVFTKPIRCNECLPHLSHIVFHDVSHLLHLCLSSC